MFSVLIVVIVIALLFDLVNGFHDAANSIATVVSTKVLTPFQAVVWAAFFNIVAYWVFDMSVGNTVAKTVDNTAIDLWVILAGLLAATTWNLLTWWLGIPSSSSHTLIGGFAGAAVTHVAVQTGSLSEGFGVIAGKEILTIVFFIFLAPIIGGFISYLITVVTIARNFWYKIIVIILLTVIAMFGVVYMIYYLDISYKMFWIVAGLIITFIIVYTYHFIAYRNRPSSAREAGMHKKLQLLSSAAFSLGHGGADSQKVMGIICAALLVYGNMARKDKTEDKISKQFAITELVQIEYENENGRLEKFKPQYTIINDQLYYARPVNNCSKDWSMFKLFIELILHGRKAIDCYEIVNSKNQVLYDSEGRLIAKNNSHLPSFQTIKDSLTKIKVYMNGKALCDAKTNDTIFNDKTLNPKYLNAVIFSSVVEKNGE